MMMYSQYDYDTIIPPESEFKEFEPRLKFERRFTPLKIVFSVSNFEPALNWNRFFLWLSDAV